jgi:hypothetical protein
MARAGGHTYRARVAVVTRPQHVSRETRRLLIAAAAAVVCLWALARLRFPDTPVAVNPVPPLLAQLAPPPRFAELAEEVEALTASLAPRLPRLRGTEGGRDTWRVALPVQPRVAAVIAPIDWTPERPDEGIRVDRPTGLVLLATADTTKPISRPATQLDLASSRFLFIASADGPALAVRPAFMPRAQPHEARGWGGEVWSLAATTGAQPGELVFTSTGELVGAVAADATGTAVLVPAAALFGVIDDVAGAPVDRGSGWLGIDAGVLTPPLARVAGVERGVVVVHVEPGSPAGTMITAGDILTATNGQLLESVADWDVMTGRLRPGDTVTLTMHGRSDREIGLTATSRPANRRAGLGLRLQPGRDGAMVLGVDAGSIAAGTFQAGDVITQVDDLAHPTAGQIERALARSERGVLVLFTRNGVPRASALER